MFLRRDYKKFVAWLLLVLLLQVFMIKSLHFHHEEACCQNHTEKTVEKDHGSCLICLFLLSPFQTSEIFHIGISLSVLLIPLFFLPDHIINIQKSAIHLRAPPAAYYISFK